MGTNFYLETIPCDKCGCTCTSNHIGKQSCGWPFLFRSNEYDRQTFVGWKEAIEDPRKLIRDEYGKVIDKKEFFNMIEKTKSFKPKFNGYDNSFYYDPDGYRFCRNEFS